jgi:hypothetical protein
MVEFVDTNVHAVLCPTHSVLIAFSSHLSIIVVFVKGSLISLLVNKLNSGVHVCVFPDLFKKCHFCEILGSHSGEGDD